MKGHRMPWATAENVFTDVGVVPTDSNLALANGTIETMSGAIFGIHEVTRATDRHWLRLAVGYQAAWIAETPGFTGRADASAISSDGDSVTLKPDGAVLAPLARRALKRLSWQGSRTRGTVGRRDRVARDDAGDIIVVNAPWSPM
jgi:hypothetical protein